MENNFLGRGWSFPPAFHGAGAEVEMTIGEDDIRQSLQILLSTDTCERIMHASYGCNLNRYLFEEMDQAMINGVRNAVAEAILLHEPRIGVEAINIQPQRDAVGVLMIAIDYIVRTTNNRYNLVYPFYIKEASL